MELDEVRPRPEAGGPWTAARIPSSILWVSAPPYLSVVTVPTVSESRKDGTFRVALVTKARLTLDSGLRLAFCKLRKSLRVSS